MILKYQHPCSSLLLTYYCKDWHSSPALKVSLKFLIYLGILFLRKLFIFQAVYYLEHRGFLAHKWEHKLKRWSWMQANLWAHTLGPLNTPIQSEAVCELALWVKIWVRHLSNDFWLHMLGPLNTTICPEVRSCFDSLSHAHSWATKPLRFQGGGLSASVPYQPNNSHQKCSVNKPIRQ